MWKKIKENWKTYLLIILSALFGADQVHELGFAGTVQEPAEYDYTEDIANTWTVIAWLTLDKQCGGGATPAHPCPDVIGKEVIFVKSVKHPTPAQIVTAFDDGLDPARVIVDVVSVIPPDKKDGPEQPGPPDPDKE